MKRLTILGIILPLLLASCSPKPVFRLQPQENHTTFDQGIEYVQIEKNGVILTMSYYRHLGDQFVMDVEIVNETDSLLRVDPIQFSYEALQNEEHNKPVDEDSPVIASRRAIDPELKLLNTDMAISKKQAEQRTSDLFYVLGQTASVASSIATDDPQEREKLKEERAENHIHHELHQQELEYEEASLRDQRGIWEIDALRKTDLWPGEYVRGYVFFDNEPDAEMYYIRFDHAQASFNVSYLQWKYKPNEIAVD